MKKWLVRETDNDWMTLPEAIDFMIHITLSQCTCPLPTPVRVGVWEHVFTGEAVAYAVDHCKGSCVKLRHVLWLFWVLLLY